MSNMDMAIDILRRAQQPLHVSEIIAQVKPNTGLHLDRESLVSALVKKVHRSGLFRTAPNTFQIEASNDGETSLIENGLITIRSSRSSGAFVGLPGDDSGNDS